MDHRLDELRARRARHAAERAAFEERRRYGVEARHAAKLAYLAARRAEAARTAEENAEDTANFITPERGPEPEAA
jgi:hypothetical protein